MDHRPLRLTIMGDDVSMAITDTAVVPTSEGFEQVTLLTSRGEIECRYRRAEGTGRAVIMVGGIGGGYDTPAKGLYAAMADGLAFRDCSSLRVRYRYPTDLPECAADVLAALRFLKGEGITMAALVGHSLGGAAVIQAAARSPMVRVIVALSTQSYGADALAEVDDGVASLFIHGGNDQALPSRCSSYAYGVAKEPKELIIHDRADHSLDQVSEEVYDEVMTWISANLR